MGLTAALETPGQLGELISAGDGPFLAAVQREVSIACIQGRKRQGVIDRAGRRAYFKYGPIRGKARLRLALRQRVFGVPFPALSEHANLSWLRRNGFDAPVPLAAGVFMLTGLPHFQFHYTQEVRGARELTQVFGSAPSALRGQAIERLARDAARLHARGFVHRDLFPRNILVRPEANAVRIFFLDAWRGGPRPGLRGPTYDLACLLLEGASLFTSDEQRALFEAYFHEREQLGKPLSRGRTLAAVARQRRGLCRRLATRNATSFGDWTPPG